MNKRSQSWSRVVTAFLITVLIAAAANAVQAKQSGPSLPFGKDLDRALERGRAEGKPVVVAFVAAWCPLCTEMKTRVFREPPMIEIADDFVWVLVDIDRQLTLAREHQVEGVPLIKVLDADGSTRESMLGLWQAEALAGRLEAVLEGQTIPPEAGELARSDLTWKPDGYRGAGICFSHVGYGPLSVSAQSVFQALRLGIRPRTPSTLGRGQFEVRGTATWSNFWAVDGDVGDPDKTYFLDFESLQNTLSLAYGITDHFQVEVELQNRSRFGGELDGLSRGFHDFFGIEQNGRDEVEKGLFVFDLEPAGGSEAVSLGPSDRGSFSRTIEVSLQHNVTCGTARWPAFSYTVNARVETLDAGDLTGGGDVDLGASVAFSRRLRNFYVYGTLGYAWFGKNNFRGLELTDTQWTALVAGEWRFKPRMSLVLQWLSTEGLIDDFDPFSKSSDEIAFGFKWELRDRGTLEVGVIENFISFDNTPDVALHAGFTQRF